MFGKPALLELCGDKKWVKVRNFLKSPSTNQRAKIQALMARDKLGYTCLHRACSNQAPDDIIQTMIQIGGKELVTTKTSSVTNTGNSALHYACRYDLSFTVIKLLVDVGGKDLVMMTNEYYWTALHELCDYIARQNQRNMTAETQKQQMAKISLLVKVGGQDVMSIKNQQGRTALSITIEGGAPAAIRDLLKPELLVGSDTFQRFNPNDGTSKQHRQIKSREDDEGFKYDAFLTHNWGYDEEGRDNHSRVKLFNEELKKQGFEETWFDEERMTGNVVDQMCNGLNRSKFAIVFVTQKYITKVDGKGPNGANDNCKKEFEYASRRLGADRLILVVMEKVCADTSKWTGPLSFELGSHLYYSFTKNDQLKECVDCVCSEMKSRADKLKL